MNDDHCLLRQVEVQEKENKKFGFYWERFDQLMEQILSECNEIQEAWNLKDRPHLQEEIGDLIQASISLAIFCNLDPHETLKKSIEKFQRRYSVVVQLARKDGYDHLRQQSSEVLMDYWNRAKLETHVKLDEKGDFK